MRVIPPLTQSGTSIDEMMLTSSTVAETEPLYDYATTYGLGAVVRGHPGTPFAHRLFESVVPNNLAQSLGDSTKWIDIGPTNRWAMFDLLRNTGTVGASPMVIEITPGRRMDAIGIAGIKADFIQVEVIVNGDAIFSHVEEMSTRIVANWYQYFFAEFTFKSEFALFDLPPVTDAMVRVTAYANDGFAEIGGIIPGQSVYLGDVEPSAEDDAYNFSEIKRDAQGNAELFPRRSLPKTSQTLYVDAGYVANIREARRKLNAIPAMWSGLEDARHPYFPSLLILGIYTRFTINLDHEYLARIALELEEI